MTRTLPILALLAVSGAALADGKFQRDSEAFPAGAQPARRVIAVGGCKETGPVTKLSLMKVGGAGIASAKLVLTDVDVKYDDRTVDKLLKSDGPFYYDFFRLKQPCVSEVILVGKSTDASGRFGVRVELD